MTGRLARRLPWAAAGLALATYAMLCHYCNGGRAPDLGAALALAPASLVGLILVWRSLPAPLALLATGALAGLTYLLWSPLRQHFTLISLTEEAGMYGLLGATFGRSLLPPRVALCTRLADQVHGPLSSREIRYTRAVTAAWAGFFALVATGSILLYAGVSLRAWSIFSNFCILPLVGTMFVAEYWVRCRVLPRNRRAGLLASVRVYFAASGRP